jgi:hypothetical protein
LEHVRKDGAKTVTARCGKSLQELKTGAKDVDDGLDPSAVEQEVLADGDL